MTAPSQEAVSAIPDAEVRAWIKRFRDHGEAAIEPSAAAYAVYAKTLLPIAADMIERLASRPTREEIRDEDLKERIREDERDRLMHLATEQDGET